MTIPDHPPEGFVVGVERNYPHPKISHLYKGTYRDPGFPMCKRGWNRGDYYSIWRNPTMEIPVCKVCLRRAWENREPVSV